MADEFMMPREIPYRETPDLSGLDDPEFNELKKLLADVVVHPDEYEHWDALVRQAEGFEGGLNRNSSPQAIAATREIYDRFLAKFPLFFVYWRRYAELEFHIAGTEAAEMVYERGVACVGNSVDMWRDYCEFKIKTSHDNDTIRDLFERGAASVGLDYLSHPFWDKYLEFEERVEAHDKIFALLGRIVRIPTRMYREYFEKFRNAAQYRPLEELAPTDTLLHVRNQIVSEHPALSPAEIERDIRMRIDQTYLGIYSTTEAEVRKRETFEGEAKRPYFTPAEVPDTELSNWRKYLDFEEAQGDYERITFLYERCLVVCALYEEFWLRYARWMLAQPDRTQEVRNILERASCVFVPIAKPKIRFQYAIFEEMEGRVDVARDIYRAILAKLPANLEAIIGLANLERRQGGLDAAIAVYTRFLTSPECDIFAKGYLVAEWATLLWKIKGSAEEARMVYVKNAPWYQASRPFWVGYFTFELQQPTSEETEAIQFKRIKGVFDDISRKSTINPAVVKDIGHYYLEYLLQRGGKDATREHMKVDREINGPLSIRSSKAKLPEDGSGFGGLYIQGDVGANESAVRLGYNIFDRYYREAADAVPNGPAAHHLQHGRHG